MILGFRRDVLDRRWLLAGLVFFSVDGRAGRSAGINELSSRSQNGCWHGCDDVMNSAGLECLFCFGFRWMRKY
jgi:hypothetical protein